MDFGWCTVMYKSIVINDVEISYVKQGNKLKVTYARCNVSNKFIKHSKALIMLKCYLEDLKGNYLITAIALFSCILSNVVGFSYLLNIGFT